MVPELLLYRDGNRFCLPVKCALFFSQSNGAHQVSVVFTDDEDEKLLPYGNTLHPKWITEVEDNGRSIDAFSFKQIMIAEIIAKIKEKGYIATKRKVKKEDLHPDCICFDLQLDEPKPDELHLIKVQPAETLPIHRRAINSLSALWDKRPKFLKADD